MRHSEWFPMVDEQDRLREIVRLSTEMAQIVRIANKRRRVMYAAKWSASPTGVLPTYLKGTTRGPA